ncbi:MAG: hypothetical protein IIU65_02770 [Clostridia bacterium]|nr:hypothetical protein [Clostridia bacterium]
MDFCYRDCCSNCVNARIVNSCNNGCNNCCNNNCNRCNNCECRVTSSCCFDEAIEEFCDCD